jgi:hypothetical protein
MKWTVRVVSETESGHTAEQTAAAAVQVDEPPVDAFHWVIASRWRWR